MLSRRSLSAAGRVWFVALLTGLIGWPSTGCVCANGSFKLFCSAPRYKVGQEPLTAHVASGHCCRQSRTVPLASMNQDDCIPSASEQVTSQGCSRFAGTAVAVPVVKPGSFEQLVALDEVVFEFRSSLPEAAALPPRVVDTGPPRNLLLAFHCFLI